MQRFSPRDKGFSAEQVDLGYRRTLLGQLVTFCEPSVENGVIYDMVSVFDVEFF